jgi:tRNA nucleotidyltransferase (CCA-adding enzyme)
MAYEHFEHPADVGIRGIGRTLDQAFEEGAKAMFAVMCNIKKVKPAVPIKIVRSAQGVEELFVEWLNALLAEKDIQGLVFSKFEVRLDMEKNRLTGTAWGEPFDAQKHEADLEVKAATLSQLKVAKDKGKWIAQCIIDV